METYLNGELFKIEQNSAQADIFTLLATGRHQPGTVSPGKKAATCMGHGNTIHYMGIVVTLVGVNKVSNCGLGSLLHEKFTYKLTYKVLFMQNIVWSVV